MTRNLVNKVINSKALCVFLILAFVKPAYITQLANFQKLFTIWKFVALIMVLGLWVMSQRMNKYHLSMLAFLLLDCLLTIIYHGNVDQMLSNAITLFAIILLFSLASDCGSLSFLKVITVILEAMIILNFVFLIIYPQGMYAATATTMGHFLGSRNVMGRAIIPGVYFSILRSKAANNRIGIRTIITIIAAAITFVLAWSVTSLVAYMLFLIAVILFEKKGTPKWFTVKSCCYFAIAVFVLIILLRLQGVFANVIVGVFNRDITFTGRTILWDNALNNIVQKPFLGHGMEELSVIGAKLYRYNNYDSAHNFFLDILYQNGVVGLVLLIVIFAGLAKRVDEDMTKKYKTLFTLFVFTYAIMINFEPFINGDMRMFMAVVFYMLFFNEKEVDERVSQLKTRVYKIGSIRIKSTVLR